MMRCMWSKTKSSIWKAKASQVLFPNRNLLAIDYGCLPLPAFVRSLTREYTSLFDRQTQHHPLPEPDRYLCRGGNTCIRLFVPASCKQLQGSHQWLGYKRTPLSAKEILRQFWPSTTGGRAEAPVHIPTERLAHSFLSKPIAHHPSCAATIFLALAEKSVLNSCRFRIPGKQLTHPTGNLSFCK